MVTGDRSTGIQHPDPPRPTTRRPEPQLLRRSAGLSDRGRTGGGHRRGTATTAVVLLVPPHPRPTELQRPAGDAADADVQPHCPTLSQRRLVRLDPGPLARCGHPHASRFRSTALPGSRNRPTAMEPISRTGTLRRRRAPGQGGARRTRSRAGLPPEHRPRGVVHADPDTPADRCRSPGRKPLPPARGISRRRRVR